MKEVSSLLRCYSFSFDIDTVTLFLKIQKWIIPEMQRRLRSDIFLMDYMYKIYGGDKSLFSNFGEKDQSFGFENSISWNKETEEEIIYSYTVSPVIELTNDVCKDCTGTAKDYFDRECHACRGTGKEYIDSKKYFGHGLLSLYPIIRFGNSALLEQCLGNNTSVWQPITEKKQMTAIEWSDTSGMHNCAIVAWVDKSVLNIIERIPEEELKSIIHAMRKTEETLLITETNEYNFRFFQYYKDTFGFQVPGNACTLALESAGMGMFGSVGKTLTPHNVDNRFQQIEFIVGLAVLTDLIEKYI